MGRRSRLCASAWATRPPTAARPWRRIVSGGPRRSARSSRITARADRGPSWTAASLLPAGNSSA
eukprot:11210990-Lingulodinium_polyedra.AAC.1